MMIVSVMACLSWSGKVRTVTVQVLADTLCRGGYGTRKCHTTQTALLMSTTRGIHRSIPAPHTSRVHSVHRHTLIHSHCTEADLSYSVCPGVDGRVTCVVWVLARWQLSHSILVWYQIGRPNIGMKAGFDSVFLSLHVEDLVYDIYWKNWDYTPIRHQTT